MTQQATPAPPHSASTTPGQVGKVRSTGLAILLAIVTFGIYVIYWFFAVHNEMKRHSGNGLGGGLALLLTIFVGFVMPYVTSNEVGNLRSGRGMEPKVSALTGLWSFPGSLILIGPLVWFVKTNGAINDYWTSQGASA